MPVFGVINRHNISQQTVTSSFGIVQIGVAVGLIAGLGQRSSSRRSPPVEDDSGLLQRFCTGGLTEGYLSRGRRTACKQAVIGSVGGPISAANKTHCSACEVDCTWHLFPADPARCARDAVSQGHS